MFTSKDFPPGEFDPTDRAVRGGAPLYNGCRGGKIATDGAGNVLKPEHFLPHTCVDISPSSE